VRFRFNGSYQRTESFVDFVESQRFLVAPVLAVSLGADMMLTLEGEFQEIGELYYTGLPAAGTILPNSNGRLPRSRYLGDAELEDTFPERTLGKIGYRLDHRFNQQLSVRHGFRATFFDRDEHDIIPFELLEDERTMIRDLFVAKGSREDYYFPTELTARFRTGTPVEREAVHDRLPRHDRPGDRLARHRVHHLAADRRRDPRPGPDRIHQQAGAGAVDGEHGRAAALSVPPCVERRVHALLLDPLELLERLAALVPPPRRPLLAYHGVLAPRARWRAAIVPPPAPDGARADAGARFPGPWTWARLLHRVFAIQVLVCERCGGPRRILGRGEGAAPGAAGAGGAGAGCEATAGACRPRGLTHAR
jgi:hypothetical protein